jgi:molybdopterin converting factor small subunit
VTDVTTLLAWLRRRERERGYLLADDTVRVTVNRQFAEPFTRIDDGDEIAVVPTSPTPPPPPRKPRAATEDSG